MIEGGRKDGGATYLRLSGAGHVLFPAGATRLLLRAQGGVASADLPAHRALVLGGRGTLLGDEFRRWGGRRMALLHLEWRVPVPFVSLGVGPYARTPRVLTVAPYVALGWAAGPMAGGRGRRLRGRGSPSDSRSSGWVCFAWDMDSAPLRTGWGSPST